MATPPPTSVSASPTFSALRPKGMRTLAPGLAGAFSFTYVIISATILIMGGILQYFVSENNIFSIYYYFPLRKIAPPRSGEP